MKSYKIKVKSSRPTRNGDGGEKEVDVFAYTEGTTDHYWTNMSELSIRRFSPKTEKSDASKKELEEAGDLIKPEDFKFIVIGATNTWGLFQPNKAMDGKLPIKTAGGDILYKTPTPQSTTTVYGFFLKDFKEVTENLYQQSDSGKRVLPLTSVDFKTFSASKVRQGIQRIINGKKTDEETGEALGLLDVVMTLEQVVEKNTDCFKPVFTRNDEVPVEDLKILREWLEDLDNEGVHIYNQSTESEFLSYISNHSSDKAYRITLSPRFVSSDIFERGSKYSQNIVKRFVPVEGGYIVQKASVSGLDQIRHLAESYEPFFGNNKLIANNGEPTKALEAADASNVALEDL